MNRSTIIYVIFVGVLIALYFLVQSGKPSQPKRLSWTPSFSSFHDKPYGTKLLYDRLEDIFPGSNIETVQKSTYSAIKDTSFYKPTAYVVINNNYLIDEWDTRFLMDFVRQGNYALIAAENFSAFLADSLRIRNRTFFMNFALQNQAPDELDSTRANYINAPLENSEGYNFYANNVKGYFSFVDSVRSEILAYNNEGYANLLRVPVGKGAFILCSSPYLLTNYHLLYENHHDFMAKAFSHIPAQTDILWDEHYKIDHLRALAGERGRSGDLSFILGEPELAWAWYLVVGMMLLYVLVERKRKQRIIPIVKPHPNLTVDFIRTIGGLYFQSQDHKNIADKKIKVFLEYIRTRYFLKTNHINQELVESLSGKSNIPVGDLRALFNIILRVQKNDTITEDRLIELNEMIDSFYERSPR
jgi:hypothetical protein